MILSNSHCNTAVMFRENLRNWLAIYLPYTSNSSSRGTGSFSAILWSVFATASNAVIPEESFDFFKFGGVRKEDCDDEAVGLGLSARASSFPTSI